MFSWFRRTPQPRPPHLTYSEYYEAYEETCLNAPGGKSDLTLIHAAAEGPFVNLVYQWKGELSDAEADELDTRARAYIACAIYDAAITAGLSCQPAPPHGERPAWHIAGERMPFSLVNAGFDVSDKTCFMQIGPGMLLLRGQGGSGGYHKKLIAGFQAQFAAIRV